MANPLLDYLPETEAIDAYLPRQVPSAPGEGLDEGAEVELASELLETTDPSRRGQFLDGLIARSAAAHGQALSPAVSARLRNLLRHHTERLFPLAPSAAGGPALRAAGRVIPDAGPLLGLELEGLSPEDQEFEAARGFVRLADKAVRHALHAAAGGPAELRANRAFAAAALRHAPGLPHTASNEGRWIRRGQTLVLLDC